MYEINIIGGVHGEIKSNARVLTQQYIYQATQSEGGTKVVECERVRKGG